MAENFKKLRVEKGIRRQLYSFYPVPNGCPYENCKEKEILGIPCNSQLGGHENKNLTACPSCGGALDMVICDQKGTKLVASDLSYFCPSGNVMDARKTHGTVIAIDPNNIKPTTQA